jgi:hypothetical protein
MKVAAGIWRHYKGGLYQVLGVGAHSETDERMVVYVSLTGAELPGPRLRIRPFDLWFDIVQWPDGSHRSRFEYVGLELE